MPDVSLEEQLKQTAASLPGIRLLVLFGSAARAAATDAAATSTSACWTTVESTRSRDPESRRFDGS